MRSGGADRCICVRCGGCRAAVHWLCKIHDHPVVYKYTDSGKGESRTPEFLQLSPIGKIPVLKDGDFVLTER